MPETEPIVFNRAHVTGKEFAYMREAIENAHLAGNGPFSRRCASWLAEHAGSHRVFLTHSCTGALEMAFTLIGIEPGDEVIMPSFTFVSTANAVVSRGGRPIFVDIRDDTLGLDESQVAAAITPKTRAIVPVHYAGVACDTDELLALAREHGLIVVEDAAQGVGASYRGRPLGGLVHLGAYSFHETKNVSCGEGGALLVNDERFVERAEVVYEKGTDRSRFFRGQVDKYTWQDLGSSYPLSDLAAAYLWAQLEEEESITATRLGIWRRYHADFERLETEGAFRRPIVPPDRTHNAHMYYLLLPDLETRMAFIEGLRRRGVHAVFHYVPLHSSEGGRRYGAAIGELPVTNSASERLVRLPLWPDLSSAQVDRVIEAVEGVVASIAPRTVTAPRSSPTGGSRK